MSEQLYKTEYRKAKRGEFFTRECNEEESANREEVLVPATEVRDLAWACGEMVRHPLEEYECEEPGTRNRFHPLFGFQYTISVEWVSRKRFTESEQRSTSWHRVESEPASKSIEDRVAELERQIKEIKR